jgi:rare lipoprotein A
MLLLFLGIMLLLDNNLSFKIMMLKKIHAIVYTLCFFSLTIGADCAANETGLASYYANKFQGRKTANGDRYDKNKLTAAHRTLPIGSQVEVVNLRTHDSVIVTINDRGPYVRRLAIDLSYAAAKEIGLVQAGIGKVAINLVNIDKEPEFEEKTPGEQLIEIAQLADSEEVLEAEEELVLPEESVAKKSSHRHRRHHSHHHKKH